MKRDGQEVMRHKLLGHCSGTFHSFTTQDTIFSDSGVPVTGDGERGAATSWPCLGTTTLKSVQFSLVHSVVSDSL